MMEGRDMEPTDRDRIEAGWATRMGVFSSPSRSVSSPSRVIICL